MRVRGLITLLMLAAALGCGGERSDEHEPREPGGASGPRLGLPVEAAAAVFEAPAEEPERDARLETLRQRWHRAADRGAPDEALVEMERSVFDADPEVSALAQDALDDLIALREGRPGQAAVPELERDAEQPLSSQTKAERLEELLHVLDVGVLEDRLEAVTAFWLWGADHAAPDEAFEGMERAARDHFPQVAELAERALSDLNRLRDRHDAEADGEPLPELPSEAERMEQLAERALRADDPAERHAAIRALTQHRNPRAAEILTELTPRADDDDRLELLSQLWYMAADRYDADGRSLSLLEDALDDPDPRVAELAGRALRDLENLASSSEQSPELADEVAASE